jgi:hypothetical protein
MIQIKFSLQREFFRESLCKTLGHTWERDRSIFSFCNILFSIIKITLVQSFQYFSMDHNFNWPLGFHPWCYNSDHDLFTIIFHCSKKSSRNKKWWPLLLDLYPVYMSCPLYVIPWGNKNQLVENLNNQDRLQIPSETKLKWNSVINTELGTYSLPSFQEYTILSICDLNYLVTTLGILKIGSNPLVKEWNKKLLGLCVTYGK